MWLGTGHGDTPTLMWQRWLTATSGEVLAEDSTFGNESNGSDEERLGLWFGLRLGLVMSSLGLLVVPAAGTITSSAFCRLLCSVARRFWHLSYAEKHFLHIFPAWVGSPLPLISVSASTPASRSSSSSAFSRKAFQTGTTCADAALWRLLLSAGRLVTSLPQPRQYTGALFRGWIVLLHVAKLSHCVFTCVCTVMSTPI